MRIMILLLVLVSACASPSIRCEGRLRPINGAVVASPPPVGADPAPGDAPPVSAP